MAKVVPAAVLLLLMTGSWALFQTTGISRPSLDHGWSVASGLAAATHSAQAGLHATTVQDLPLEFVENRGQWEERVQFVARARDMMAHLEAGAIVLQRESTETDLGHVVRLCFENPSANTTLEAEVRLPGEHHFLLGNDRARWRSHVPAFGSVLYRNLYDGIDLRVRELRSRRGLLEYDLLLAAGADLSSFVVRCEGVDGPLRIAEDGGLVLTTSLGPLVQTRPVAWQELPSGNRRSVVCHYRLLDERRFGFVIEGVDDRFPVTIDPGLVWSTFFGGISKELLLDLVVDASGVTFVGETTALDLPVSPGAYSPMALGGQDVFVCRLDSVGGQRVFSTYLGGDGFDQGLAIATNSAQEIIVGGLTVSSDFPVTPGAFDTVRNGISDAYISRLSPDGSSLLSSTFLGGGGIPSDLVIQLRLTGTGDVIAMLVVSTPSFPTTAGAFDTTHNGGPDVAVVRLDGALSTMIYSTFIGGSSSDVGVGLAIGSDDRVVVAGAASSADFPITPGAFGSEFPGGFVTCLTPDGSALVFSTALRGSNAGDAVRAAAFGPNGDIYVAGQTQSFDFPTTPGAFLTQSSPSSVPNGFVTCFDPTGSELIYSTLMGGGAIDRIDSIVVDSAGAAYVGGGTQSPNLPTTPGAFDTLLGVDGVSANLDAFISKLSPDGSALEYSSFLGGLFLDALSFGGRVRLGRAVDGSISVGTTTDGPDYPTTPGVFQETFGGLIDSVVTRLDMLPTGVSNVGSSSPGCQGPLVMGITGLPQAGDTVSLTCLDAPPFNTRGLLLLSQAPLTTPLQVAGVEVWIDPGQLVSVTPVTSNSLGATRVEVRVPDAPGISGYLQFFWPDLCAPGGWSASNALEVTIQ